MTNFSVKVHADKDCTGSNRIEVSLDTRPKTLLSFPGREKGMALTPEEDILGEEIALYYAVERIAQLEAELAEERANKSNLTMQVIQDKWRESSAKCDSLEAQLVDLEEFKQEASKTLVHYQEALHAHKSNITRLIKAGDGMYTAFDALMPGLANISLNDYSVINDNPIEWRQAKKAAEELMDA